jgi:hypothetical protein
MPLTRFLPVALLGAGLALAAPVQAQDLSGCYLARGTAAEAAERPSPLRATVITIGGQEAKLCYGSPSARDRTVMGELVPMGEIWRLGANEATALHLPFAAEVGGVALEPGVYSIWAVPGAEEWEFFMSAHFERWGIPVDEVAQEAVVGSTTASVAATDGMVESLTFTWVSHGADMGHLVMEWEHTRVEIPIHTGGHH